MKKIKVLQVNKLYYPKIGGIEKVVQDIAEGLNKDVDMRVLVCQEKGKPTYDNINGIKVLRAGSLGTLWSLPISFTFILYFKKIAKKADVLQIHMPFPLADLAYLFSGYDGKIVLWWHSDVVRQQKAMFLYKPVMNYLLSKADTIIVATQGHIDSSLYLSKYKNKCKIIPYGIDLDKFYIDVSKDKLLNSNNNNLKKILFIGRLVYYKGLEVLIDAMSHVQEAELFIIGEGVLKQKLLKQISSLGLTQKIHLLGELKDEQVKSCLRDCDIFVLPSIANSEAFGIVQIEAMAFGKPIINTSLPTGVPYVSIDNETGLTVLPNNVEELSKAIQKLINNDELRKKLGENALNRVKEHFDKKLMLKNIYEIYRTEKYDEKKVGNNK